MTNSIKYTNLLEAAAAGMTGTALIVWTVDDQFRRNSLYHAEIHSGGKTVCGRQVVPGLWQYNTITLPELARRVAAADNLCSECRRQILFYDFTPSQEPTRIAEEVE